ncbi:MAG: hypothetical protein FIA89_04730 [Geobacter sp.]|nr:hypothetical protein [Geobacter sp.]
MTKEEKTELTALLSKLRILPHQGQVILHCNNSRVAKVEPHVVIACRGGEGREKAEQKLQYYRDSARKAQAAGDKELADRFRSWAVNLEKILAEEG